MDEPQNDDNGDKTSDPAWPVRQERRHSVPHAPPTGTEQGVNGPCHVLAPSHSAMGARPRKPPRRPFLESSRQFACEVVRMPLQSESPEKIVLVRHVEPGQLVYGLDQS